MNSHLYSIMRRLALVTAAVVAACMGSAAMAAPQAMDNEEMSEVVGGDGVSIMSGDWSRLRYGWFMSMLPRHRNCQ